MYTLLFFLCESDESAVACCILPVASCDTVVWCVMLDVIVHCTQARTSLASGSVVSTTADEWENCSSLLYYITSTIHCTVEKITKRAMHAAARSTAVQDLYGSFMESCQFNPA